MDKKVVIFLVVGLVVGFVAGYFTHQLANPNPATPEPAAAGAQPAAGTGASSPEADAQMAEFQQQVQQLEATIKKQPDNLEALIQLGNIYYDTKQFDQAITCYERAVKLDGRNLSARVDLATSRYYVGQLEPAVAGLQSVLKEDPNHPQALYNLGIIMLHGANDLQAARDYWSRLVATNTTTIDLETVKQRLAVIDNMIRQGGPGNAAPGTAPKQ
ncbi:MAG TPA: tetratricopeptide repeat protein [Acidobacteriota bacterium]|nr:tetratricopeptide repeat protein [Acidobacteriota bacterium]